MQERRHDDRDVVSRVLLFATARRKKALQKKIEKELS